MVFFRFKYWEENKSMAFRCPGTILRLKFKIFHDSRIAWVPLFPTGYLFKGAKEAVFKQNDSKNAASAAYPLKTPAIFKKIEPQSPILWAPERVLSHCTSRDIDWEEKHGLGKGPHPNKGGREGARASLSTKNCHFQENGKSQHC